MMHDKALVAEKLRKWEGFLQEYELPAWDMLPGIELYMDQVIALLTQYLNFLPREEGADNIATPAMINNYVKQKVILPPVQKKYGREQLAQLMVVCLLKKVLSINEIAGLMELMIARFSPQEAYDSFCSALENALVKAFTYKEWVAPPAAEGEAAVVAQSAALAALMGKLVVEDCLAAAAPAKPAPPQKKPAAKAQAQKGEPAEAQKEPAGQNMK